MTNRLRELEKRVENFEGGNTLERSGAEYELKGYKMAQEDLKPVLDAAQEAAVALGRFGPSIMALKLLDAFDRVGGP